MTGVIVPVPPDGPKYAFSADLPTDNTIGVMTGNRKMDGGPVSATLCPGVFYVGGNGRAVTDV